MKITNEKGYNLVDFEAQGRVSVTCDACKASLGEHGYPSKKDAISIALKGEPDESGYEMMNNHHFCGESCLASFLNKRAGAKK